MLTPVVTELRKEIFALTMNMFDAIIKGKLKGDGCNSRLFSGSKGSGKSIACQDIVRILPLMFKGVKEKDDDGNDVEIQVFAIYYEAQSKDSLKPYDLLVITLQQMYPSEFKKDSNVEIDKFMRKKHLYGLIFIDEFDEIYRSDQSDFIQDTKNYATLEDFPRFLFFVTGSSRSLYTLAKNNSGDPNRTEQLIKDYPALEVKGIGSINHTKFRPVYLKQKWNDEEYESNVNILYEDSVIYKEDHKPNCNLIRYLCGTNLRSISQYLESVMNSVQADKKLAYQDIQGEMGFVIFKRLKILNPSKFASILRCKNEIPSSGPNKINNELTISSNNFSIDFNGDSYLLEKDITDNDYEKVKLLTYEDVEKCYENYVWNWNIFNFHNRRRYLQPDFLRILIDNDILLEYENGQYFIQSLFMLDLFRLQSISRKDMNSFLKKFSERPINLSFSLVKIPFIPKINPLE